MLTCMVAITMSYAQNTQLFRFVSKQVDTDGDKLVLHHDLNSNTVNAVKISDEVFNTTDGYLQAFIVKRISKAKVLIASAKRKSHFLKRNENTNQLVFAPISSEEELPLYTWELTFAGNTSDEVIVQPVNELRKAIVLKADGVSVSEFKNEAQQSLQVGQQIANTFRFTLQRINNVF